MSLYDNYKYGLNKIAAYDYYLEKLAAINVSKLTSSLERGTSNIAGLEKALQNGKITEQEFTQALHGMTEGAKNRFGYVVDPGMHPNLDKALSSNLSSIVQKTPEQLANEAHAFARKNPMAGLPEKQIISKAEQEAAEAAKATPAATSAAPTAETKAKEVINEAKSEAAATSAATPAATSAAPTAETKAKEVINDAKESTDWKPYAIGGGIAAAGLGGAYLHNRNKRNRNSH